MSANEITQAERALWQRRAVGELTAILKAYPDLPVIAWSVGPAGSMLVGHVNGLDPAGQVRQVFGTWRAALGLTERRETTSGGVATFLHAAADRNRVRVRLTATVVEEDGVVRS